MLREEGKTRDREGKRSFVLKVGRRLAERSIRRALHKKLVARRRERKKAKMQCYYSGGGGRRGALERIERLASENAVVVFSISSCCMCQVAKSLFCSLGVSPTVHELDEVDDIAAGQQIKEALVGLVGDPAVPAVFIGGKLVGGLDCVMATHISGNLVPLLKEAGALWL